MAARCKGDSIKVDLAEQLRREATMMLAWIAARLQIGTTTFLAHLLYLKCREAK